MVDFAGALGGIGAGISDFFAAAGYGLQAQGYDKAAGMEDVNVKLVGASTDIQTSMAQRQIYKAIGGQRADIASAGFAFSGSGIDLARDSASQGAMSLALIENQGQLDQQGHAIQASVYRTQAAVARQQQQAANISGIFGIASGILGLFSDRRLKHHIVRIGQDEKGIKYEYSYLGSNDRWRGYMADEIEKYDPAAITEAVGFKSVDPEYHAERI